MCLSFFEPYDDDVPAIMILFLVKVDTTPYANIIMRIKIMYNGTEPNQAGGLLRDRSVTLPDELERDGVC